jgi:hypothetical protein
MEKYFSNITTITVQQTTTTLTLVDNNDSSKFYLKKPNCTHDLINFMTLY